MVKKKVTKKRTTKKKSNIEEVLIKNSADMQNIMLKLIERFDKLSIKIGDLLELFEDSAKILVKKEMESGNANHFSEELLEKINKLIEQNRVIARGLTLIHEPKEPEPLKKEIIPKPNSPYLEVEENEIIPGKKTINLMQKPSVREQEGEKPVFDMPE